MAHLKGVGASPGFAVGRALLLRQSTRDVRFQLPPDRVEAEARRLIEARERARRQLEAIKTRVARSTHPEHAYLFDAQLLMLDDPMLVGRALTLMRTERLNAEWALQRAFDELSATLDTADDPYLRERKGDMADVTGRLRGNLTGSAPPGGLPRSANGPCVLIADELTPSAAAQIDWTQVTGFATDTGSWTSHTAILARSLHVPAVVGLHDASRRILPGATVVVDGTAGEVVIDPSAAVLSEIRSRHEHDAAYERSLQSYRGVPAVTADGVAIRLEANIELPEDVPRALEYGAEGIGLYRSEFLLAGRPAEGLTEDAQYVTYRRMLDAMAPRPVTIRTFDTVEDQIAGGGRDGDAARSRFGLRGIRLCLRVPALFETQLRALLRAAAHGRLRIMFPFVSGLEELRQARGALGAARETLAQRGIAAPQVPVGVMIEIPSAALTADLMAREADFLSIGTNDLIQYCLAVDRTDDRISELYQPVHPSVLRLVRQICRAGRRAGRPVSVCGEMASEAGLLPLLIGLGITDFSMNPAAIPTAKQTIRLTEASRVRLAARHALGLATAGDVQAVVRQLVPSGGRPERTSA